jgi:nicotinamide mononucleotide transporter
MHLNEIWQDIVANVQAFDFWGLIAFISGILAVVYLIKENIWTWPFGIIYTIISLFVFYESRLYGDLLLHIFFLVLNVYGWIHWIKGKEKKQEALPVTRLSLGSGLTYLAVSGLFIYLFAQFLMQLPVWFEGIDAPSLPYWDSATSMLSVTAMWLTARKKLDNWYYWFAIDVLATGIYFYKELYFYSVLYLVYISMAVAGYLAWKKSMHLNPISE